MVAQGFFDHESPDGGTLVDRLTGAGYLGDEDAWVVGENIGWGQGTLATARSMVTAWMGSAGHRENLLSGDYTEVGLGLALGTPADQTWGATYTTDFGAGAQRAGARARTRQGDARARKKATRAASCARAASARRGARSAKPRPSTACARSARVRTPLNIRLAPLARVLSSSRHAARAAHRSSARPRGGARRAGRRGWRARRRPTRRAPSSSPTSS